MKIKTIENKLHNLKVIFPFTIQRCALLSGTIHLSLLAAASVAAALL